ncbi:MAG: EscU/YscU/HrcU family type III secretion system export apparatus switch protein [Clostridiales bacterium]
MSKEKKAVALKYNLEQDLAPVVIASGYGAVAERIINIAEERGIPVYRDDSAASMMCMLEVGANIPEELYQVVATIYVQILETANKIKTGSSAGSGGSEEGPKNGAQAGAKAGLGKSPADVPQEEKAAIKESAHEEIPSS